ncbi:MAG: epoxyqueuosine reductase QueH [Oscillospiraceae bacterium]|nr:epoxyqueuosine reductase QueH [Oscillospiraceae bacterium]
MSGNKKSLLLHSCCAPCSSSVLEKLTENYNITLYFYNPNIMPAVEYKKRLSEQKRLLSVLNIKMIEGDYDNKDFLKAVKGLENEPEGKERCKKCIEMRLSKTAQIAGENKFNFFTTTLSVSPHKNAEMIYKILKEQGEIYGIKPVYEDFKKKDGYKRSLELSKKYNLYRQNYCGCVFLSHAENSSI